MAWALPEFPEILWEIWGCLRFSISGNFPGNLTPAGGKFPVGVEISLEIDPPYTLDPGDPPLRELERWGSPFS
mgnify:CR=1 FL=1